MRRHLPRLTSVVLAGTMAVLGACADEADGTSTGPGSSPTTSTSPDNVVTGAAWRGALLDARLDWMQLEDGTSVDDVSSFRPTRADAQRFEEQLPAALDDATNPSGEEITVADLEGYVRQYTGVEGGGVRQLIVAGICDEEGFPEWDRAWIEVSDGGACFWDATMDLGTGEIIRLYFHGQA